jgi:hypothetical protein
MLRRTAVLAGLAMFALTLAAPAQQAKTPNSVVLPPPPQPITVVPLADALKALPGVHKPLQRPRVRLEEQVEEFNEHQRAQLERRNRQIQQRFQAFQSAGGWQQAFLSQLEEQRAVLPNSREQIDFAEQFIANFLFCGQPLIASVDSQFQDVTIPGLIPPTLDKSFVVEPLASIVIDGCNFGNDVGEVRLILNQDTGSFLPLQIIGWGDNNIMATLGRNPGIQDQDAQLVVIKKDGTASIPASVQFFQHRVAQVFDVAKHANDVEAVVTAHTTQDQIEGVIFSATGVGGIAGSHYTFCCSAVSGTDRWLFKLQNGWQVPATPVVYRALQFDEVIGMGKLDFLWLSEDGSQECGIFSSGEGFIDHTDLLGTPPDFPEFQSEVDIAWHVGSNCSGVVYDAQVFILGPEGVPYD